MQGRRRRTRGWATGTGSVSRAPRAVAILAAALAIGVAPVAMAQGDSNLISDWIPIDLSASEVEELIRQLDAPSFAKREAALDTLIVGSYDETLLDAALERAASPEQRHRLLTAANMRDLYKPRGAVGISIDQRFQRQVVVRSLVENLPAMGVLEVGDCITHIDGQPITSFETFRRIVQNKAPGEEILMRVERPIRAGDAVPLDPAKPRPVSVLDLPLRLGSAKLLDPNRGRGAQSGMDSYERRIRVRNRLEEHSRPRQLIIQHAPRRAGRSVLDGMPNELRLRVEADPRIRAIDQELATLTAEDLPDALDRWENWARAVDRWRREPGLRTDERRFRDAVALRFAELVGEGIARYSPQR